MAIVPGVMKELALSGAIAFTLELAQLVDILRSALRQPKYLLRRVVPDAEFSEAGPERIWLIAAIK